MPGLSSSPQHFRHVRRRVNSQRGRRARILGLPLLRVASAIVSLCLVALALNHSLLDNDRRKHHGVGGGVAVVDVHQAVQKNAQGNIIQQDAKSTPRSMLSSDGDRIAQLADTAATTAATNNNNATTSAVLIQSTNTSSHQQQQRVNAAAERTRGDNDASSSSERTDVIGFAVTITSCSAMKASDDRRVSTFRVTEGAAVLQYSIHRASVRGSQGGRYDYKLYALYHPDASTCAETLGELGYTLLKRDTPVNVDDIRGDYLRERIRTNGCCGEKELIKLEAFALIEHSVMVLLDLDVLILKPLDPLFDLMLKGVPPPDDQLQWPALPLPHRDDLNLLYTVDYNMVKPARKVKPVQGGFVVLRPNVSVYEEFRQIVLEGNFHFNRGWGRRTGKFWGVMTIQGLLAYYYVALHPDRAAELNRCAHNNMSQNPISKVFKKCYTKEKKCEDCRARSVDRVFSTHFTSCEKPWLCRRAPPPGNESSFDIRTDLCGRFHHEWFRTRHEMELSWGRTGYGNNNNNKNNSATWEREHNYGFCSKPGEKGYQFIDKPFGSATLI